MTESLNGIEFFQTRIDQILVDGDASQLTQLTISVYAKSQKDQQHCVEFFKQLNVFQKERIFSEIFPQKDLCELLVEVIHHSIHADEIESRIQVMITPKSINAVNLNKQEKEIQSQNNIPDSKDFDLTDLFSQNGLLDADEGNVIPSNTNTQIIIGVDEPLETLVAAANIAARLGLESTGITLPIAALDNEIRDISQVNNPILIGKTNRFIQRLNNENHLILPSNAHHGIVRVVPHAFGESPAVLIIGSSPSEILKAGMGLSEHIPYLWERGVNSPTIEDVKNAIKQLLTVESPLGQLTTTYTCLKQIIRKVQDIGKPVTSVQFASYVIEKHPESTAFFTELLRTSFNPSSTEVKISPLDENTPVWSKSYSLKWEVSDFWDIFEAKILPKLKDVPVESQISIEVRVSEPNEIRKALEQELQNKLTTLGFQLETVQIRVLSAYKQGYIWITEGVIPQIRDLPIDHIIIKYQEMTPPTEQKWADPPSKWLLTLYPCDDIIERELEINKEQVKFQLSETNEHTFVFEAYDSTNRLLYRDSFDVRYVERPYLEPFPEMTRIHPETGWVTATVNQETVVDERIVTDLEKLWDKYQGEVLPSVKEYILQTTENNPTYDKQPFFESLVMEAHLSEPDAHLGVREELYSTLEQLHEDLFFVGLDLVNYLGMTTTNQTLRAPGAIIPWPIRQNIGKDGIFKATLNAFSAKSPKLEINVTFEDDSSFSEKQDFQKIACSSFFASTIAYQPNKKHCTELELLVEVEEEKALENAENIIKSAQELCHLGFFQHEISWPGLETLTVILRHNQATKKLKISSSDINKPVQPSFSETCNWTPTMNQVISAEDVENALVRLSQHRSVTAWIAGRSIKNRQIYAVDVTAPTKGNIVSQAKIVTFKPTYLLACHNHGHESSSTNAALTLIDYLLKHHHYLNKVNVCVIPFQNPDGAALHYEWQKEHPNWMLHGARFNAFNFDVNSDLSSFPKFRFPESEALYAIWKKWLPDVIEDAHGFPSHEWATPFEGFSPMWYRVCYLPPSAFYVLSLPNSEFTDQIYRRMIDDLNMQEELLALNLLWNERYHKYARKATSVESTTFKGIAWYLRDRYFIQNKIERQQVANLPEIEPRIKRQWGNWITFLEEYPNLKTAHILTEIADSTAQGAYMELCANAHFIANLSIVKSLYEQAWIISKTLERQNGKMYLKVTRDRRT